MFCTNCGKLHPDGANFCPHCGSPIGENEWEAPVIPEAYVAPLSPLSPDFEPEELGLDEDVDLDLDIDLDLDAEGYDPEPESPPAPAAERPEPVYEPAPVYDAPAPGHGYTVPGGAYAPVGGNAPGAPAAPYIPADAPPRKKKTGLVVCLVLVAVLLVAVVGMAGAFSMAEGGSDYDDYADYYDGDSPKIARKEGGEVPDKTGAKAESAVPEAEGDYDALLASFGVADESVLEEDFGYKKVDCYAMVDADGGLTRMELAYTMLDMVQAMAETYYYPIETFTGEERDMFVQLIEDELDMFEEMDYVTVATELTNDYYILTMVIDGLDDTDIMNQATEAGFLTEEGALYVSKSASEDDYLAAGYVKR